MAEHLELLRRLAREDRMKGYRRVSMARDDRFWEAPAAVGLTPVAVELRPGAEHLIDFVHPERALYVFGPEDGSLPKAALARCHRFLWIPTHHCLNLSAAANPSSAVIGWVRAQRVFFVRWGQAVGA
jgi:tRNA(Leu) C34 or U34 (ribose-2'-O)-methylase TrmL